MDVKPPLVARRVKHLKRLNMDIDRVVELYLEEREAIEMKYLDLCKPLYEERGNVLSGRLDDNTERIHKEGEGKEEEEGLKGDNDSGNNNAGGGEEREGAASL